MEYLHVPEIVVPRSLYKRKHGKSLAALTSGQQFAYFLIICTVEKKVRFSHSTFRRFFGVKYVPFTAARQRFCSSSTSHSQFPASRQFPIGCAHRFAFIPPPSLTFLKLHQWQLPATAAAATATGTTRCRQSEL